LRFDTDENELTEHHQTPDTPDLLRQPDFREASRLARALSIGRVRSLLNRGAAPAGMTDEQPEVH